MVKQYKRVMNPVTLNTIVSELKRARADYPLKDGNLRTLQHFVEQMPLVLKAHDSGKMQAVQVYATAITIAVMAIRIAEEGASNFSYASYAPNPGPLFLDVEVGRIKDD